MLSENVSTELAEGAEGALATASAVQTAVAAQTSALGKVEAGLQEFLSIAPAVAGAIDPAIAVPSQGVASLLLGLLQAFKSYHTATVVPAAGVVQAPAIPAAASQAAEQQRTTGL